MSNLSCTEPDSFTPHHNNCFHRFDFAEPTLAACVCVTNLQFCYKKTALYFQPIRIEYFFVHVYNGN